jgi:phosphatidylserine/phosphatidylglycerophosphate/cardiolipin synthase-like enzyme
LNKGLDKRRDSQNLRITLMSGAMRASDQSEPGVWCYSHASRAHVVIDADAYFEAAREAMMRATCRIMLIGWDFDSRISLSKKRRKKGDPPARLGDFIVWLADRTPGLEIRILKWSFGALKTLGRGSTLVDIARWSMHKQIDFKFDGAHPFGCSHHQKIVVIDDAFAVCGGIDMTSDRWDTRDHVDGDPRRKRPNRSPMALGTMSQCFSKERPPLCWASLVARAGKRQAESR